MAKRDRIGKPRPGSIRYEAIQRGVTEARIRKERAIARGLTNTQGRGHARAKIGEIPLSTELRIREFRATENDYKKVKKTAEISGIPIRTLWTAIVSPGPKGN
jgi:hypothetical protein